MILMINGAFGAGKTTAANHLSSLIPNSMIFDPEEIGYMLRKIVPEGLRYEHEQTDDFQDMELWKALTVKTAIEVKRQYNRHLIVPMTLYKIHNFEYIYNGFRSLDEEVYHYCLIASEATIRQRLHTRGDTPEGWTYQQIDKCANALRDNRFQEHIDTDQLDSEQVIEQILNRIGVIS
ncbi:MAG: AAA family ATPase [Candidatus Cohnella colombiensis]|uniref:AAA family ATPase n=1 Tax=Candidatus Cohnella colombiensis TaxID=3121368 RepID=A0AA95F019_9BACL|nr:MAG: AAA family ATPase [Cohnella sp.]